MSLQIKLDILEFLWSIQDSKLTPGFIKRFIDRLRASHFFDEIWDDQYDQTTRA